MQFTSSMNPLHNSCWVKIPLLFFLVPVPKCHQIKHHISQKPVSLFIPALLDPETHPHQRGDLTLKTERETSTWRKVPKKEEAFGIYFESYTRASFRSLNTRENIIDRTQGHKIYDRFYTFYTLRGMTFRKQGTSLQRDAHGHICWQNRWN